MWPQNYMYFAQNSGMIHLRHYIYTFFVIATLISCNNNADKKADDNDSLKAAEDSTSKGSDSLVYVDCYEKFFQNMQRPADSATVMLTPRNGGKVKLKDFLANDLAGKYARWGLKSIDNDTIPELVMYNYTGGAHCCDEIYVFSKDNSGYTYKARLFGGFVCIDAATNIFTYSLNETLGYFFSCYACGFSDSTKGFKTIREIELRYVNGKFEIQPYDAATEKQLIRNLEILNEHGYEDMQDGGLMDSGWRKEFAMNLAVWHYNHGKNWDETKKIFDKYYNFKDAVKVWKEFYTILKDADKENSF